MNKTFAQMITGTGRAAVAAILVAGPDAESIVKTSFVSASNVKHLVANRIYFGQWVWLNYREDLVVTRTNETAFEIHCHGGHLAAQSILDSLVDQGVQVVNSDSWLLDRSLDRFSSEAYALLPNAVTVKTAAILLDQCRHAVLKKLSEVDDHVGNSQIDQAKSILEQMLAFAALGRQLVEGFEVVLVGVPNSGKSSLVNTLLGFERAIVYDQPGTTRDVIATKTAIQGWPVTFVDTAGLRSTQNRVESIGIEKARQRVAKADLVLEICDQSNQDLTPALLNPLGNESDSGEATFSNSKPPTIRVGTKADLAKAESELTRISTTPIDAIDITTSSVTGSGIQELCATIADRLVPNPPPRGQAIPLSRWQTNALGEVLSLLDRGSSKDEISKLIAHLSMPATMPELPTPLSSERDSQ